MIQCFSESIGFLKDHQGRFIYDRTFLLQFKDKNIEPPKQLSQYSDVYRPQSGYVCLVFWLLCHQGVPLTLKKMCSNYCSNE